MIYRSNTGRLCGSSNGTPVCFWFYPFGAAICRIATASLLLVYALSAAYAQSLPSSKKALIEPYIFVVNHPLEILASSLPTASRSLSVHGSDGSEVARLTLSSADDTRFFCSAKLTPGYYEIVGDGVSQPIVVVVDPASRTGSNSRLATDNGISWLVKPDQWELMATHLQLAGIHWVRERLAHGEVEQTRGVLTPGKYLQVADILRQHGLQVYSVFHDSPGWARADHDTKAPPDDLRDVFAFTRRLAGEFQGKISAWESWNEADIDFFSKPASECAAYQKAAYLGFRSVDPRLQILGPSLALPPGHFAEDLLANDTAHYIDIWNYHIYADPDNYAARHESFITLLSKYGVDLPCWVTEAGALLQGPEGVLGPDSRREQAAIISRAFPLGLAAGENRHFWFVFPYYREGQTDFGLFAPDNKTPFPGYAALSTATYALGSGEYLGEIRLATSGVHALVYRRGAGSLSVALWNDGKTPSPVEVPIPAAQITESIDHLGGPIRHEASGSGTTCTVGRATIYLIAQETALKGIDLHRVKAGPNIVRSAEPGLKKIVLRMLPADARADKDVDGFIVTPDAHQQISIEVYNFADTPFEGVIRLHAGDGWPLDQAELKVRVEPMGRKLIATSIMSPTTYSATAVTATAIRGQLNSSPAQLQLRSDINRSLALKTKALEEAMDTSKWANNIAANGRMEVVRPEAGSGDVRFHFTFNSSADNWAYPELRFAPGLDLSSYDGIRLEYRTSVEDSGQVRLMLVDERGDTYFTATGLPGSTAWKSATILFSDLARIFNSVGQQTLDLKHISVLRVGANSKPQELRLDIRNVSLVKLK